MTSTEIDDIIIEVATMIDINYQSIWKPIISKYENSALSIDKLYDHLIENKGALEIVLFNKIPKDKHEPLIIAEDIILEKVTSGSDLSDIHTTTLEGLPETPKKNQGLDSERLANVNYLFFKYIILNNPPLISRRLIAELIGTKTTKLTG